MTKIRTNGGIIGKSTTFPTSGIWALRSAASTSGALFNFTQARFGSPITALGFQTSSTARQQAFGPTQAELQTFYNSNNAALATLLTQNTYFKAPFNGYQWFTVPSTGSYQITAQGGHGGSAGGAGARGCKLTATFSLVQGEILWIVVGHAGGAGNSGISDWCSAGGGGGTMVALAPSTGGTTLSNISSCLLLAAGGQGSREGRFGTASPANSSSLNGTTGSGFTNNFKVNNINGTVGGYAGYFATGGFGGGTASDDSTGFAGGYDAVYSSAPNSFVNALGTNVTRVDSGDALHPNAGYVQITKI